MVRIIIGRDGKVRDLGISSSSGHLVLDERALEIAKGIRMPPLPPELTGREFFIDLPVSFKLDKG